LHACTEADAAANVAASEAIAAMVAATTGVAADVGDVPHWSVLDPDKWLPCSTLLIRLKFSVQSMEQHSHLRVCIFCL
jgi:hypothetical protein